MELTAVDTESSAAVVLAGSKERSAALEPGDEPATPEQAASEDAVELGAPVAVETLTSETQLVEAMPDGSFRLTVDSIPSRVQQNGEWVEVDPNLNLSETSGYYEPVATTVPVRFSAGGHNVLAQIELGDGSWLTETWPLGDLPVPVVAGAVALYENVMPGVDLRLTATATGMTEVLVIKSPEAAALPELQGLTIGVEGADLDIDQHGTITATPDGAEPSETDLRSSSPLMWDSSVEGSDAAGPAPDTFAIDLVPVVQANELELGLDAVADNEDLVYPVFVDPDWTGGRLAAWYTDQTYGSQSYPEGGAVSDASQMVGYVQAAWSSDGQAHRARAYWKMDTSAIVGKTVISAVFNTTEVWSSSCNPRYVQLWRVSGATPGATWDASTGVSWAQVQEAKNIAYGNNSSCPASAVGFGATEAATWAATNSSTSVTLGLKAADENDTYSWKRFDYGVQLIVTYNTRPTVATSSSSIVSPTRACGTSSSPAYVPSTIPLTFRARLNDADGGNLTARLYVQTLAGGNALSQPFLPGATMAVGYHSVSMPSSTLAVGTYRWQIRAFDALAESTPGAYCYFSIEDAVPATPTLAASATSGLTVGRPVEVTVSSSYVTDQPAMYQYFWVPNSDTTTPAAPPIDLGVCDRYGAGTARSTCVDGIAPVLLVVAPIAEQSTLWVRTVDEGGKASAWVSQLFSADADRAAVTFTSGGGHGWPTSLSLSNPIPDSNTSQPRSLPLGNALNYLSTATGEPFNLHPIVDLTDLVPINVYKTYSGSYVTLVGSSPSIGYVFVENAGWAFKPGSTSLPASTKRLCSNTSTTVLTTTTSTSCGSSATLVGHVATVATTGWSSLLPCTGGTVSGSYVTTAAACAAGTAGTSLGLVATFDAIADTSTAVVDTSESFAVSAHLKADTSSVTGRAQTAVSQSSGANSGFQLGISSSGKWQFCMTDQRPSATPLCAVSTTPAGTEWTFVTGVWDKYNQQVRLYAAGEEDPIGVAWRAPQTFEDGLSSGGFTLGNGQARGSAVERWFGLISGPMVFQGIPTSTQRTFLSIENPPNEDE